MSSFLDEMTFSYLAFLSYEEIFKNLIYVDYLKKSSTDFRNDDGSFKDFSSMIFHEYGSKSYRETIEKLILIYVDQNKVRSIL